jgi:hypothetical protein
MGGIGCRSGLYAGGFQGEAGRYQAVSVLGLSSLGILRPLQVFTMMFFFFFLSLLKERSLKEEPSEEEETVKVFNTLVNSTNYSGKLDAMRSP